MYRVLHERNVPGLKGILIDLSLPLKGNYFITCGSSIISQLDMGDSVLAFRDPRDQISFTESMGVDIAPLLESLELCWYEIAECCQL